MVNLLLLDSENVLISTVHEFSESNSGIRAMVPLKESNRLKMIMVSHIKFWKFLMCGSMEFLI